MTTPPNNSFVVLNRTHDISFVHSNPGLPLSPVVSIRPDKSGKLFADFNECFHNVGDTYIFDPNTYYDDKDYTASDCVALVHHDTSKGIEYVVANYGGAKEIEIDAYLKERACIEFDLEKVTIFTGLQHEDFNYIIQDKPLSATWKGLVFTMTVPITIQDDFDELLGEGVMDFRFDFTNPKTHDKLSHFLLMTTLCQPAACIVSDEENKINVYDVSVANTKFPSLICKGRDGNDSTLVIENDMMNGADLNDTLLNWINDKSTTYQIQENNQLITATRPECTLAQYTLKHLQQYNIRIRYLQGDSPETSVIDLQKLMVPDSVKIDLPENDHLQECKTSTPFTSVENMPSKDALLTNPTARLLEEGVDATPIKADAAPSRRLSTAVLDNNSDQPSQGIASKSGYESDSDQWYSDAVHDFSTQNKGASSVTSSGLQDFHQERRKHDLRAPPKQNVELFDSVVKAVQTYNAYFNYRISNPSGITAFLDMPLNNLQKRVRYSIGHYLNLTADNIIVTPDSICLVVEDSKWASLSEPIRNLFEDMTIKGKAKAPNLLHRDIFRAIMDIMLDGQTIVHLRKIFFLSASVLGPLSDIACSDTNMQKWVGNRSVIRNINYGQAGTLSSNVARQLSSLQQAYPVYGNDITQIMNDAASPDPADKVASLLARHLGTSIMSKSGSWIAFVKDHLAREASPDCITQCINKLSKSFQAGYVESAIEALLNLEAQSSLSSPSTLSVQMARTMTAQVTHVNNLTSLIKTVVEPSLQSTRDADVARLNERMNDIAATQLTLQENIKDLSNTFNTQHVAQAAMKDAPIVINTVTHPNQANKLIVPGNATTGMREGIHNPTEPSRQVAKEELQVNPNSLATLLRKNGLLHQSLLDSNPQCNSIQCDSNTAKYIKLNKISIRNRLNNINTKVDNLLDSIMGKG